MRCVSYKVGKGEAELKGYIHEDLSPYSNEKGYRKRPCIIVLPGGGYSHLSPREQDPVVFPLFASGYQVFVLLYSVTREKIDISSPSEELKEAMALIKSDSESLDIDDRKIALMGFSAGGHLAASYASHPEEFGYIRPDLMLLCYPVILVSGSDAHEKSVENLTGGSRRLIKYYDVLKNIDTSFPPTFIWHTCTDRSVSVQNSLALASELTKGGIPFELHIFDRGSHGLCLGRRETGNEEEAVQPWMELAISFINRNFDFRL